MSKLTFFYGTMGSSKTADALMLRYQFIEKGYKVLLLKPAIDNRDDEQLADGRVQTCIKSRIGLKADAIAIGPSIYLRDLQERYAADILIVDEAQFLTSSQVSQLRIIADSGIPVYCYGLRTDFSTRLFEGAQRLFEIADDIVELHATICDCGKKSIVNARIDAKGNIVNSGDIVDIGADDKYKPMCYNCYRKKLVGEK